LATALLGLQILVLCLPLHAEVDLASYARFLDQNRHLTAGDLLARHGADIFQPAAPADFASSAYADSIDHYFNLTPYEKQLLNQFSFVVTERLRPQAFGSAYLEIYNRDLPLFVSTDAILHALHMSYDAILMELELAHLRPQLIQALELMHRALPDLAEEYSAQPALVDMLADVDVYLTVSLRLLGQGSEPHFGASAPVVGDILALVAESQPVLHPLFGQSARVLDYSQFTVRGHYTRDPELGEYFQAMIWLGRTELYLDPPAGPGLAPLPPEVIQRQVIDVALLDELATRSGADQSLQEMERILAAFVGEQDNLTLAELRRARAASGIHRADQLLDMAALGTLQESVRQAATQEILSQVLLRDPLSPEPLRTAPAFLLVGQRFVIDSYVAANVVFDRIQFEGTPVFRGLPSTLDVLFALGNDTATQFLADELAQYHYAPNLAALRFLVDGQEREFWDSTLYNGWLQAIRQLRPPHERAHLPAFMQTHAWWQLKMNTQLAAWAQLRHDNLLYAKQSYTAGVVCEYPETYIEPVPEFYGAIGAFADHAARIFGDPSPMSDDLENRLRRYFGEMSTIADTLASVAQKELDGVAVTPEEKLFLQTVLYDEPVGCAPVYLGWYSRLYYTGEEGLFKQDLVVADVHTQPTDAAGSPVGHVLHAGTGPLDMAVLIADLPHRENVAFIGPVMSYYEHVTLGFERLTDEEWQTVHAQAPSFRPQFANLYLADERGDYAGQAVSLATAIEETPTSPGDPPRPDGGTLLASSYPNPFNASTLIHFTIPPTPAPEITELVVHNSRGQIVRTLLRQSLTAGHYSIRWDGLAQSGQPASSGAYYYHLRVGSRQLTGKMTMVK